MSKIPELLWFQMPQGEELVSKLRKVATRTGEVFSRVESWQRAIQASAQNLNRCGEFEIDRAELAFNDRVDEETVDKVLRAFEAPDVALIVDGKCATFIERGPTKDQKRHAKARAEKEERERLAREGAAATTGEEQPRGAEAAHFEPRAPRDAQNAAREAPESSSSKDDEEREEVFPSSVIESPAREGGTMMTDEELINLVSGVNPAKLTRRVASEGLPVVRKWLADGFDLTLDVLPELTRIVAKLDGPLGKLSARFVIEGIRARRETRLTGAIGPPSGRVHQSAKPLTGAQIRARFVYGKSGSSSQPAVNGVTPFAGAHGRPS